MATFRCASVNLSERDADRARASMNAISAERVKHPTITDDSARDRRIVAPHCSENVAFAGATDLSSDLYICPIQLDSFGDFA